MNEARSIILALGKPMAQIVQIIDDNKIKVESVKKEIELTQGDITKFEKKLKFQGVDLNIIKLDSPVTVCSHEGCKKYVLVGQNQERNTHYTQICHEDCTIKGLATETP